MTEISNNFSEGGFAPYLSKYGLHSEPFSNDIHDEFFLLDVQRSQRLNMLYHLAQNSELLLVVTGKHGSGKTTLLQHFIDMGDDTWRSCVVDANSMMNPEQLLIQIAEGFGLPQDSVTFDSGIEMLKKRLIDMRRSELVSMLIIDDAHELPAASLTMLMKLSELSDENEGLLRIVLFSEPQLIDVLNASSLKDVRYRITHTLEMPILSEQETIKYIEHRLAVAGLKDDATVFSKAQLKKIHRLSSGLPGKINAHAHEMLTGNQAMSYTSNLRPQRLRSAITVLIILGLTIGITWFFTRDALHKLTDHLAQPTNTSPDAITSAQQPIAPLPLMPVKPLTPPPAMVSDETTAKTRIEPGITKNLAAETAAIRKPVNAYALRQPDIQTKPITKIDKPEPVSTPVITSAPEPEKPVEIKPAPAAKTSTHTETVIASETPATTKTVTPLPAKPVVQDWYSRQNPKHFTLQVMGSHERRSILRVMRAHKLSADNAAVLQTQLNGKDWFILVYGNFTSRDSARAAVSSLPKGLQLTKPWPRQISDIKQVK